MRRATFDLDFHKQLETFTNQTIGCFLHFRFHLHWPPPPPVFRKWHNWIRHSTMNTESILPLVTMITNINITLLIILYQSLIYIYINIIKRILLIKYPLKIISTSIQWNEIFANLWGLKIQNSYTLKGSYRTFDYSWIKFNILILLPWQYNENELDIFFHQISMMQ